MSKVFVSVTARFDEKGNIRPLTIEWADGRQYTVDKVLDVRRAASLKAGGTGIRYTVQIGMRQRYLFYEAPQWFVECDTPIA